MKNVVTKMKKAVSVILVLMLFCGVSTVSYADIDLSGMSFEELVALKEQINLAIWNSKEWQEVEVPQGVWEVGKDIPVGKWTIKAKPALDTSITVGPSTINNGTSVDVHLYKSIYDENNKYYDENKHITSWTVELNEGDYVQVQYSPAIFMPYTGKPSLGFKTTSGDGESESAAAKDDNKNGNETADINMNLDEKNEGKLIDLPEDIFASVQPDS